MKYVRNQSIYQSKFFIESVTMADNTVEMITQLNNSTPQITETSL